MLKKGEEFKINKAIMHVLDIRQFMGKTLSDYPLGITADDNFYEYLKSHVLTSILSMNRKSANFKSPETNLIKQKVEEIIEDEEKFVENSKFLASNLYSSMQGRTSVPADVVYLLCEKENGEKFVSILVLEFTENFFHKIDNTQEGVKIDFNDNILTLPKKTSSLKKCAFIHKTTDNYVYSMILDIISVNTKYFFDNFLNAEFIIDDNEKTKKAYEVITKFAYKNDKLDLPTKYLDEIEIKDNININTFLEENFGAETATKICEEMEQYGIIETDIAVNKEYVNQSLRRVIIKLSNGSTLRIPYAVRKAGNIKMTKNASGKFDLEIKDVEIVSEDLMSR